MSTNVMKTLFTLIFCISFSVIVSSQVTERVKTRAENRANRRADQKIDQAVDRTLDKIEGLFRKKKETQSTEENRETRAEADHNEEAEAAEEEVTPSDFLSALNIGGKFEAYENPIRMNVSMDITTVNQRGKTDKMNIKYTFDTWATAMEFNTDGKRMRILLDNKEGFQTMVTEGDGEEIQAIKMRQRSINLEGLAPDESDYTITETAKTRTIDGYFCKEYIIEHEDGTTNSWVTEDIDIDMMTLAKAMSAQAKGQKNKSIQYFYGMKGFPVEAISVSENGKETTTIRFYDIKVGSDVNLDAFNLDGIEVMSIGF